MRHTPENKLAFLIGTIAFLILALSLPRVPVVDAVDTSLQGQPMVADGLNPWNPGARCVHISELSETMFPVCQMGYLTYEWIYVDKWQPNRDQKIIDRAKVAVSRNYCIVKQYQIYCASMYRPCEMVDVPGFGEVAIARQPCLSNCEVRTEECIPVYNAYPGLSPAEALILLGCAPAWEFDFGKPYTNLYTESNYTQTVRIWDESLESPTPDDIITFNVTNTCYEENKDIFAGYAEQYCPPGTHNVDDQTCAFNCPEPLIEDGEYDAATIMLSIASWFSFILTAFLVISFLLGMKKKLAYPSSLSFFFIVCIMCVSWTFCLASMIGHQDLWCEDETSPNRWGDGWCTVQGVTYVYFTLAGAMWWFLIGLALFCTVAFNFKPQNHIIYNFVAGKFEFAFSWAHVLQLGLHTLCWGVPLGIIIIALGNHKIGYGGGDFWCTIHSNEEAVFVNGADRVVVSNVSEVEEADAWNLTLLTVPILLITLLGTIMLGLVVIFAWIRSKEGWKFFWHQWRLLALMCLYIWTYSFVFSHRIAFTTQRHAQFDEYADNILCLRQKFTANDEQAENLCPIASQVNYPLWFIAAFNTAIQGVLVFFIYGTSKAIYKPWAWAFKRMMAQSSSSSGNIGSAKRGSLIQIVGQKIRDVSSRASQAYEGDDEDGNGDDNSDEDDNEDRSGSGSGSGSGRAKREMTIDEYSTSDNEGETASSSGSGGEDNEIEMEEMGGGED